MIEKTPSRNRVTGFYRGIVKAHSANGKCKIFWPGVMPQEYNEAGKEYLLPDAEQATSLTMFGPGKYGFSGNGFFYYPEIGSVVWGFFENEDVNFPVYFAGTVMASEENKDIYNDLSRNKPKGVFNLKTPDGNLTITVNDGEDWVTMRSTKKLQNDVFDSSISLSKYGGISIKAPFSNVEIDAMNITLKASNSLALESDKITHVTSRQQTRIESEGHAGLIGKLGSWIRGYIDRRYIQ